MLNSTVFQLFRLKLHYSPCFKFIWSDRFYVGVEYIHFGHGRNRSRFLYFSKLDDSLLFCPSMCKCLRCPWLILSRFISLLQFHIFYVFCGLITKIVMLDNAHDNEGGRKKMASSCLGAFGSYKLQYSKQLKDRERPESETVWVIKRYCPTDGRSTAPVPRHKHLVLKKPGRLPQGQEYWIPVSVPPLASFDQTLGHPPKVIYMSHPGTRSEEWSTLRQMLPTYGNIVKVRQPDWGIALGTLPINVERMPPRLPHVNSCMTKFLDDMYAKSHHFRLY